MPPPESRILGIALQGREDLLVAVLEPDARNDHILALLSYKGVGQAKPQGKRTVISHRGHAQLAARRLVFTAQNEELVAAGTAPVPQAFLVTGIPGGFKVVLLPLQFPGPEAEPDTARLYVPFRSRQLGLQVAQPPPLLVQPVSPGSLSGLGHLTLGPGYPPLQGIPSQQQQLPYRRHLPLQGHPRGVEHPGRYPVATQVVGLQRSWRPAGGL